jgi:beta-lactamase regulating signal transducer with metallopeptidase domain
VADPAELWLVTWLLHSTLLYGGAWLVDRLPLLRAPAAREQLWRAAMLGALLTATVQCAGLVEPVSLARLFTARASPAVNVPPAELAEASAPTTASAAAPAADSVSGAGASLARAMTISPSPAPPVALPAVPVVSAGRSALGRLRDVLAERWASALLLLWLVGAGFTALRLLVLGRRACRELDDRVPVRGALAAEFAALCAALRVRRPALSVAPAVAGPISLPNGEIVVPPWAIASLDARQRQALLAHELAHVVRRDPQWLAFALGLHALLWLQPLHALARRRLAALAELQADGWAARAIDDPRALAECLAECAERLAENHVPLFGAALTHDSLLVERVDRLLDGIAMRAQATSWMLRGGLLASLVAAAYVLPGCDVPSGHRGGLGSSMTVSVSDDGDTRVKSSRPGYSLALEADGSTTFAADETDIATLAPGCAFVLDERLDGVEHEYTVTADRHGTLTRSLRRDGVEVQLDAAGKRWLAEALPRMFRESGFDAGARVASLLASGGPARVLAEVDLATNDHARARPLGELLATAELDCEQAALALASAGKIGSSLELHSALSRALSSQSIDAPRFALVLRTAGQIASDSELAELLIEAAGRLPDSARGAWVATAGEIDSDFELGRAIRAGLERSEGDAPFTAELLALAGGRMDSSSELASVLAEVAPRAAVPAIATAYLDAARSIDSDSERSGALLAVIDATTLDPASLGTALDVTAEMGSRSERRAVLKALAGSVARDGALSRRYREVASTLSSSQRGEALAALDEARRN